MSKNALKSIDIDLISGHCCSLIHQYLAKLPAQFDIDNEEKFWGFDKMSFCAAGHFGDFHCTVICQPYKHYLC